MRYISLTHPTRSAIALLFNSDRSRKNARNPYFIFGGSCQCVSPIIDGKVWIQHDGTEEGIANDLVAAGVPKAHIILGFKAPEIRKYTEFAVF